MWAGVFGSVSRGTQKPDSDVDILVGFSQGTDLFYVVCDAYDIFKQRLPQVLGREVDVIPFVENRPNGMGYVHMEGLLSSKTIWGEESWAEDNRKVAEGVLREGFTATMDALKLMRGIRKRLPSSEVRASTPASFSSTCIYLNNLFMHALGRVHEQKTPNIHHHRCPLRHPHRRQDSR
jgi:predicted nucleotidyltransferase